MKNQTTEVSRVEESKVFAERLNGLAASVGCLALVGAYLTTGQIILRFCVMNKEMNYWKTAEQMNGRLAMMGFFAAVINYGITGWIIPGII